ncbi:carboxylesterase/lipase family protein [Bdellovibrio bacteriovorus]|uniref:carboxylesterase/lipase family protein n=1 Tax=Bdellovibrio bacteriovorus TaxID=959 RepID=UPI0035A9887A
MGFVRLVIILLLFSSAASAGSLIAHTRYGSIEGMNAAHDTTAFLGIPYAHAPVGNLRWKAPRSLDTWSGVKKAQKIKSSCPQIGNFFANVPSEKFGVPVGSEDCLYLNIWKPQKNSRKLPVVFWIHGGSNFKGTASDPIYDGSYVSSSSQVVFVSINYRLGLLGAFADSILEGSKLDRSGNFTTLDLLAGLKWVRDNIENFGGDPHNVTIMGQSAGCMNVWGLLQTPLAKDLFHKAVCSAGMPNLYPKFLAEERSQDFINQLVVNAGFAKDKNHAEVFLKTKSHKWRRNFLYSLSADDLVQAQKYMIPFQHITDGKVFPESLLGTVLGHYNQVPLILGSTIDEGTYIVGGPFLKPSPQELWNWIQSTPEGLSETDLVESPKEFRAVTYTGSEAIHLTQNNVELILRAHQKEIYQYSFAWKETPSPWKEIFGAVHGMDAIFYLGNFVTDKENFSRFAWTPENKSSRESLRNKMSVYFKGFFWTGDPNAYLKENQQKWIDSIIFDSNLK